MAWSSRRPDRPTRQRQDHLVKVCNSQIAAAQQPLTDVRLAPRRAEERTCGEARWCQGTKLLRGRPNRERNYQRRQSVTKSAMPAELLRLAGGALRDHDVD